MSNIRVLVIARENIKYKQMWSVLQGFFIVALIFRQYLRQY